MATNWLAESIKRQREKLGITQAELAQRLGVHKQTVVKYEAGAISLPSGRLSALAHALELPIDELFRVAADLKGASVPQDDDEMAREADELARLSRSAPRHARALPLSVREYLGEFRLRLIRGGASDEEIDEALSLMQSPQLFTFYKGGALSEFNEDQVLRGMKAIGEGVVIPELNERGRKIS